MAKSNRSDQEIATALALVQQTNATAKALADAKVQSDIQAAIMSTKIDQIVRDVTEIKSKLDEKYTTKEEHIILQKVVEGNALSIRENTKFNDTLNGKIWGTAAAIGAVFAVVSLLLSHFWR